MSTVMIIGASRGIGLELVRQYAAAGWRVHATTRVPTCQVRLGPLVETSYSMRSRCATTNRSRRGPRMSHGKGIDVVVHNAGVSGRGVSAEEVRRVNTDAPIHVVQALLPAVTRSREKKIVVMTSQLGARRDYTGSLELYGDSKAALNDAFRSHAPAWGRPLEPITTSISHRASK